MENATTLQARFPEAENDLRERVNRAVEQILQPLPTAVPMATSCRPVTNGYNVYVSSKWLPGRWFETILSESSLRNLDSDWQNFCNKVAEAFIRGPLNMS